MMRTVIEIMMMTMMMTTTMMLILMMMLRWPIHKEKCGETRCLICAPAMMAAAQVLSSFIVIVLIFCQS